MAFDYKKEYKEFYMPKNKPSIVDIPKMNYIAVRGKGNPNEENILTQDMVRNSFGGLCWIIPDHITALETDLLCVYLPPAGYMIVLREQEKLREQPRLLAIIILKE